MNNSSKEDYLMYKKLDIKKVSADYYQRNKEEIRLNSKLYYDNNKEKINNKNRKSLTVMG